MEPVKKILRQIKPYGATLVAVTKHHTPEEILPLYEMGIRDFGENRVQELIVKKDSLPDDIRWHMIGHLQGKKVKKIAPFIHMIQSLDRVSLWEEIDKQAKRAHRVIPALLEVKVAREATKSGFNPDELIQLLHENTHQLYPNVNIRGVMGMASFTSDTDRIREEFTQLHRIFNQLQHTFFSDTQFDILSMGMSGDYPIALECGTNMVRIGSRLFQ